MKIQERFEIIKKICEELKNNIQIQDFEVISIIRENLLGSDNNDYYIIKRAVFIFLNLEYSVAGVNIYSVNIEKMKKYGVIKGGEKDGK